MHNQTAAESVLSAYHTLTGGKRGRKSRYLNTSVFHVKKEEVERGHVCASESFFVLLKKASFWAMKTKLSFFGGGMILSFFFF